MLFHYHFWTPFLEETEKFYVEQGFRVSLRSGKFQGEFKTFNPPLEWDDFREKEILFRIIEVRKGAVNITFGYGKKPKFDHIGYLVPKNQHDAICENAGRLGWEVEIGERRTFINTPYRFRIELQTHQDAVEDVRGGAKLAELNMIVEKDGLISDLERLFAEPVKNISFSQGESVTIKKAIFKEMNIKEGIDPNGVQITRFA